MEFFHQNMAELLLELGLFILVVEVLVLGFSTFFLFFLAVGLIATGLIFFSPLIEATSINAFISVSVISVVSALLLWKPLKRMQNKVDTKAVKSDFIGHKFTLDENLVESTTINHQYSGVIWKVSSDVALEKGVEVEVIKIGVGKMKVQQVEL